MLHVVDNLLPADLLEALRQLCVVHGELKQTHPGDALFSWRADDGSSRSIHALEQRQLMERYLDEHLLPVSTPFGGKGAGVEWGCNGDSERGWRVEEGEVEGRRSGAWLLPLLSTVF